MSRSTVLAMNTVEQAAGQLGLKVSTVRSWVLRRKIAYHKVGGRAVRIPQHEIDRLLEESRVPAKATA
jgi:excisionase family DNA binding protein